jgi:hypothetical protein
MDSYECEYSVFAKKTPLGDFIAPLGLVLWIYSSTSAHISLGAKCMRARNNDTEHHNV